MNNVEKLRFADDAEKQAGWTLSPKLLDEIQDKIMHHDYCPTWEGIELVLLAFHGLDIPKS